MSLTIAIIIAAIQGVTELFPVSSLGHAVVLPAMFGLPIDQHSEGFLPFLVLLHIGTAIALLAYFWRDWWELGRGALGFASAEETQVLRRLAVLIALATLPAVLFGFALNKLLREAFATPLVAALFLVVNGGLLFFGERLRHRAAADGATLAALSWRDAIAIGFWQCTALIPGISRSGATMVGGLRAGLSHADAAHFSFLLATPIILGATVHEAPKLLHADAAAFGLPALVGLVVAGGVAYVSIALLMRYFRTHEVSALKPFAYYCGALGLAALALLVL